MKQRYAQCRRIAGAAALSLLCRVFSGCVSSETVPVNHNADLVMGIAWQQNSGEYAALCYQAFNLGRQYILSLPGEGKRAAVLDIDETVLDNSKYAAWMVTTGNPWANETWEAWCNAADAGAVPGALAFARFLTAQNIEVFYVSNRPASTLDSTIANLDRLGFPLADTGHVLLMQNTSDKTPRLEAIGAMGYAIVLAAGDNLDDFDSSIRRSDNPARRRWAAERERDFGFRWIVLPNPVYGTFEPAMKPGYYGLPPEEKAAARLEAISSWRP
jgi:5'-nucleotidase (lipoprotein e(P4) family)